MIRSVKRQLRVFLIFGPWGSFDISESGKIEWFVTKMGGSVVGFGKIGWFDL